MGDILSIILLLLLAILLVGPRRLPQGIEALWLAWTNFQRSQHGGEQISLEQARSRWLADKNPLYSGIQLLYAATEHLEELRVRMFRALIALVICVALTLFFSDQILKLLLVPLDRVECQPQTTELDSKFRLTQSVPLTTTVLIGEANEPISATVLLPAGTILPLAYYKPCEKLRPIYTKPTEMFVTTFRVDLMAGFGLALPFIVYQVVAFLMPGLLPHEKRYIYFLLPSMAVLFVAGVAFAYLLMLPVALQFLFTFNSDIAQPLPSINDYINFVSSILFWIGLTFQTPLVIFFLAWLKLVTVKQLTQFRRFAIVGAFIIAALVTPTPDPLNQSIVALPIILLYELGIILARIGTRLTPRKV